MTLGSIPHGDLMRTAINLRLLITGLGRQYEGNIDGRFRRDQGAFHVLRNGRLRAASGRRFYRRRPKRPGDRRMDACGETKTVKRDRKV
jgi:hypothetical protein